MRFAGYKLKLHGNTMTTVLKMKAQTATSFDFGKLEVLEEFPEF
jgi:hypothetical protein